MSKVVRLLTVILCGVFLVETMALAVGPDSPVKLSVDLIGEYTDNRDSTVEEESNVDISLQPRVDAVFDREGMILNFYYAPAYRYRTDPAENASGQEIQNDTELFHDLGINVDHKLTPRVKARLSERLNYTDDPSIQEGGATLRRDSSYLLNTVSAGATCEFTRKSWLDLMGYNIIKRYDDDLAAAESDEDSASVDLTLWNQISRNLSVLAVANVGSQDYDNSSIDRGYSSVSGGVGLESIFSPNLRGGVRVGWITLDYNDSALDSGDAPFVSLSVQAATIPSTRIAAAVTYGIEDSDAYPFSSQEKTDISTKVEWDAVKDLTFTVSGVYRVGDYDSDSAPTAATSDDFAYEQSGEETTVIATAEAAYKIGANSSIKFVQSFEDVDSDVSTSFNRNASKLVLSRQF